MILALLLRRAGYCVSKPYGEACRYDLLIDDEEKIWRVQVKTGRLRQGAIVFKTYSSRFHRKGGHCRPYTAKDIDFFGVYCPDLRSGYLVPIEDVRPTSGSLRFYPAKNGSIRTSAGPTVTSSGRWRR